MIDGIPDPKTQDKRLLAELQKYAAKMREVGPQVVDPVGLLCKSDGRYQVLPGQGTKRIMALRLAGYRAAVADISIPKKEDIEVKAENIDERPPQERSDSKKEPETTVPENTVPTKEDGQTSNPTMARTRQDPASGHDLGPKSKRDESMISLTDADTRPSVREKLEKAKVIAAEKQAVKELSKLLDKTAPKPR